MVYSLSKITIDNPFKNNKLNFLKITQDLQISGLVV